jgi:hypothetical protein
MKIGQGPNWGCSAKGKKEKMLYWMVFLLIIKSNMSVRVKMSNLKITNGKIFSKEK